MNQLDMFSKRLIKIGIIPVFVGNYPWIYLRSINGNIIKPEDYYLANHGFTIAFMPMSDREKIEITDIKKTFEVIRKYK